MNRTVDVVFLLVFLIVNIHCSPLTVRKTANGPVEGVEEISSMGQSYYAFRSIPYAEPPVTGIDPYTGEQVDRRFKAPETLKRKWTNNLDVRNTKNGCIVSSTVLSSGRQGNNEDCLFLNIYVPADGVEKKTVIVFIHGGGFVQGLATEATMGPDFLLSEDNIVVFIQYRLGIFGFLTLGEGDYTGNMGLKDQRMALKWIYENIEHFSGNRSEILLFGESAGGASVIFHMLNEESRSYFTRAYTSSGSAYSYFALREGNHRKKLQECFQINDLANLLEYLRATDSDILVECYFQMDWGKTIRPNWVPTIEEPGTPGAIITQSLDEIYNSDKAPVMDTMFSFNSQEQLLFDKELIKIDQPLIKGNGKEVETIVQLPFDNFNELTAPNEYRQALTKLREAYFSNATDIDAIRRANIALMSDLNFRDSILKTVIQQTISNRHHQKNTFLFRIGINDALNLLKIKYRLPHDGTAHLEDTCYYFHFHSYDAYHIYDSHLKYKNTTAYNSIKRLTKIITNFARTGDPSIEGDTSFERCKSSTEIYCQEITNDSKTTVTTKIQDQLHYDTWRDIEGTYNQLSAKLKSQM